jgi:hypothetical protein
MDCDNGNEYYMLETPIWLKARYHNEPMPVGIPMAIQDEHRAFEALVYPTDGMLCVGCVEMRLGRRLRASDFRDLPLNRGEVFPQSPRLKHRVQRYKRREKQNPIAVWFDEANVSS